MTRPASASRLLLPLAVFAAGSLLSLGPVSYTHLDVYKRQIPHAPGITIADVNMPIGIDIINDRFSSCTHPRCV